MAFTPDFYVVTVGSPATIQLVIEAKLRPDVDASGEAQLKRFMLAMGCPVGLLITPNKMWIYKDSYTNRTESSIERRGPFPVPSESEVAKAATRGDPSEFEQSVRAWLERIARVQSLKGFSVDAIEAFKSLILPALADGFIQSSGPVLNRK